MKRALLAAAAIACASCGAQPLMKLPVGPGTPASEAAEAIQEASSACVGVRTLTAEIAVSGTAGGHRIRGRLLAGFAGTSIRLEAIAPFGPPVFIFAASGMSSGDAVTPPSNVRSTLLLPRDDRVLRDGNPREMFSAVTGIDAVDPGLLLGVLTGCFRGTVGPPVPGPPVRLADDWALQPWSASAVYVHRAGAAAPWLVTSVPTGGRSGIGWRADYRDHVNGLPHSIRFSSVDAVGKYGAAFDLQLTLSQVEVNVALGPDVFTVQIPRTTTPITLQELRRSGPFAATPSNGR